MKLFELLKLTQKDFDTYDTVYDEEVTVCFIEKENDNYDKFCNGIVKKVDVIKQVDDYTLVVDWTKLIKYNMDKFRAFTKENWWEDYQYENDEDEFIYQWIKEIHNYMVGNVSDNFYKKLVELVDSLHCDGSLEFDVEEMVKACEILAVDLNERKRLLEAFTTMRFYGFMDGNTFDEFCEQWKEKELYK